MATFALFDQSLNITAEVTPAFQMIMLMSPELYVTESGDNLVHRYEIGGVVWDSHIIMDTSNAGAYAVVNEALLVQRLDNDGVPVAEFVPFAATEPVGVNDETILPTHVIRTRNSAFFNASASEEVPLNSFPQYRRGPENVRVRRALDDFQGLFLQFTGRAIEIAAGTINLTFSTWGQLYFRFRT